MLRIGFCGQQASEPAVKSLNKVLLYISIAFCTCGAESLSSGEDYTGFVPSLAGPQLCLDAFLAANALQCERIQSASPGISIERCSSADSAASGLFVLCSKEACTSQPTAPHPGQDVFRVRLTGPEVHLLDITYCGADTAYAEYSVSAAGDYHAEILHLYENFMFAAHTPLRPQYLLGTHSFAVAAPAERQPSSRMSGAPRCSRGRWVLAEEHRDVFRATCTAGHDLYGCGEAVQALAESVDVPGMRWQPYDCAALEERPQPSLQGCLAGRRPCFFGDSHMRHVFNSFVAFTEGGGRDDSYWQRVRKTDWAVMKSDLSAYHVNTWGDPADTQDCTDIFINFGQARAPTLRTFAWPASFKGGQRAWSAQRYAVKVAALADALADAKRSGKRVHWVTTNPFPLQARVHVANIDWRTDPQLLLFNAIGSRVMAAAGIDTVDVWHMAAPVAELSYDRSHFKGILGYYIALKILDIVCNQVPDAVDSV